MKLPFTLVSLLLLFGTACTTTDNQSRPPAQASVGLGIGTNEPEKRGLVKQVEDVGYPYAVLTIAVPGQPSAQSFTLNMERVPGAGLEAVAGWTDRQVAFTYTSEQTNALLDVQQDGKSLLGDEAPTLAADTKHITGKLRGANKETTGDEPGKLMITTNNNTTETFPFFVTKELVAANGSVVVGYFEERTENKITAIKLLTK